MSWKSLTFDYSRTVFFTRMAEFNSKWNPCETECRDGLVEKRNLLKASLDKTYFLHTCNSCKNVPVNGRLNRFVSCISLVEGHFSACFVYIYYTYTFIFMFHWHIVVLTKTT